MRVQDADAALVARCKQNDLSAFDELVERYQHKIYHYAKRMVGNETDAEDITQDVFLKALQSLRTFREESSLQTWLFRIATNLCRDTLRRRQREKGWLRLWQERNSEHCSETVEWELPDRRADPATQLLNQELSALLDEAIDRLPVAMREVLVMHDMEEMPYEEIAQALGIPLGTVKSRLFHARARIRQALASYINGE